MDVSWPAGERGRTYARGQHDRCAPRRTRVPRLTAARRTAAPPARRSDAARTLPARLGRLRRAPLLLGLLARLGGGGVVLDAALLIRWVLQDEGAQLVRHVGHAAVAARLAVEHDVVLAVHLHRRLRQRAARAQHELLDELVHQILKDARVVRAVHRARADLGVVLRDGAELDGAVLGEVLGRPLEGARHVARVHDHRLDAVAAALNLTDDAGHLRPRQAAWAHRPSGGGARVGGEARMARRRARRTAWARRAVASSARARRREPQAGPARLAARTL